MGLDGGVDHFAGAEADVAGVAVGVRVGFAKIVEEGAAAADGGGGEGYDF